MVRVQLIILVNLISLLLLVQVSTIKINEHKLQFIVQVITLSVVNTI